MLLKVGLPKNAKILQNKDNEIIIEMPQFYVEYQTAVSVFSVKGHTLVDFEENETIGYKEILINQNGKLEVEDSEEDYEDEDEDDKE